MDLVRTALLPSESQMALVTWCRAQPIWPPARDPDEDKSPSAYRVLYLSGSELSSSHLGAQRLIGGRYLIVCSSRRTLLPILACAPELKLLL